MKTKDARSLSPEAQEDLRRRVVKAVVEGGTRQTQAAQVFGVARPTVNRWVGEYRAQGASALASRKRGRPRRSRLAGHQAALAVRLIEGRCPDQLRLPFALWTREAVVGLLAQRFGLSVSVWTAGRYLARWGLTPQKPLRRAYEQDPAATRRWLAEEYPAIRGEAKASGAEIHWGDEMGLRSDCQAGRSYGRKGKTPVVPGTGQRFGCNMISSITNRGTLRFRVFDQRFTAGVFIDFLSRLVRQSGRKVFLIVDGHPVHRAAKVKRWLAAHADAIRLFYLPGYSPQLNPDEYLNHDVKANSVGRRRARDKAELLANVRGYLRSTQKMPEVVTCPPKTSRRIMRGKRLDKGKERVMARKMSVEKAIRVLGRWRCCRARGCRSWTPAGRSGCRSRRTTAGGRSTAG
jgi:transposase